MNFTEIGAVVGFLTGTFVLYDRIISGRPLASIGKRSHDRRDLQLVNTSKSDIFIKRIKMWGNGDYVARDSSVPQRPVLR